MSDYYLIGTKYENTPRQWDDMFPEMVRQCVVSTGYAGERDLGAFYGKNEDEIIAHLKKQGEESRSYSALKKFLQLKPGDWIAMKGSGAPHGTEAQLTLVGYAVVTARDGRVYRFDAKRLGHMVNVEFIETDIARTLALGYGRTVHKITHVPHIREIFGSYYRPSVASGNKRQSGTQSKNIQPIRVEISKEYVTRPIHNEIQQSLFEYLQKKHLPGEVTMEQRFVDITVEDDRSATFFEVKPYSTAKQCIREALGQLLEYAWYVHGSRTKSLRLVVVGPKKPNEEEKNYIRKLGTVLPWPFEYQQWSP